MRFYTECALILVASCLIGIVAIAIDRSLERPAQRIPDVVYPVHTFDGADDPRPFLI